jgi:hypothetical protein
MAIERTGWKAPPELTPEQQRLRDRLLRLIEAKIPERFATFGGSSEGLLMPDGTEEVSGFVIDEQGRVFFFWMDWDRRMKAPALGTWKQVDPEPHWAESREYQRARAAVGLDPA